VYILSSITHGFYIAYYTSYAKLNLQLEPGMEFGRCKLDAARQNERFPADDNLRSRGNSMDKPNIPRVISFLTAIFYVVPLVRNSFYSQYSSSIILWQYHQAKSISISFLCPMDFMLKYYPAILLNAWPPSTLLKLTLHP
jgi:hypothetical protein